MIIRPEQLQAFEDTSSPEFERYMLAHLEDFSPLHGKSLGEAGMRNLIKVGRERAGRHGFTHRGPVKFYIETMILVGVDFDTDPQYPLPGKILRDPSIPDQTERADRAHAWLMDLLDAAAGANREYARRALYRARATSFRPKGGYPLRSPVYYLSWRRPRDGRPGPAATSLP